MEYLDSIAYRSNAIALGRLNSISSDAESHHLTFSIEELFLNADNSNPEETWEFSIARNDLDIGDFGIGLSTGGDLPAFSDFREGSTWFLFLARLPDRERKIVTQPVLVVEAGSHIKGFESTAHGLLREYEHSVSADIFRAALGDALRGIQETQALNARNPGPEELPDVFRAMLRRRAAMYADQNPRQAYTDSIAHAYCVGTARLHKPELLDELLRLTLPETHLSVLRLGFGTSEGREYLLRKISDEKLSVEKRRRYVLDIEAAYGNYFAVTEIHDNGGSGYPYSMGGDNGWYLKRIALAAIAGGVPADLRADLIRTLGKLLLPLLSHPTVYPASDIQEALRIIDDASPGLPDPRSRFEARVLHRRFGDGDEDEEHPLSTLIHGGPDPWPFSIREYKAITARPGEMVNFGLEAHDVRKYSLPTPLPDESRAPGEPLSQEEIDALLNIADAHTDSELVFLHVLEHRTTGATFEAPQEEQLYIEYNDEASQWSSFRIPSEAPSGEYKHELRVLDKNGVVLNRNFAYPLFIEAG